MPTLTQIGLRVMFYGLCVYAGYLLIKLIIKRKEDIRKGKVKDMFAYALISTILLITLGNIIIFNIDMYDAILGTMEIHTAVYILLVLGGFSAAFFLDRAVKEEL